MDKESEKKNPFFLPALITALFSPIVCLCGGSDAFVELYLLMSVASFAALIFSCVGLVISKRLQAPFIGCVFCLALSFLEMYFIIWLPIFLSQNR